MLPRGRLLEKNDRTRRSKPGNTSRFGNKTILQGRLGSPLGLVTFRSLQLYWVFIGRRWNFDGKVLSRIANGISFTRFVLLLSWLPMFENVKVITQKGENYILALVSKQI